MNKSSQDKLLKYAHGNDVRASDGSEWNIIYAGGPKEKWKLRNINNGLEWRLVTKSKLKKYYKPFIHEDRK